MRRKTKRIIKARYILISLSIFCFVSILFSFKYQEKVVFLKTAVGDIIAPMQKGLSYVGSYMMQKQQRAANIKELQNKNRILEQEVENLSYKNKILQQDQYELAELRKLYKLTQKFPDYPKVAARVISNEPGNWYHTFTIDKGKDDGLKRNMNVLAGNGLVGIITEIGHHYAKVRSIIDDMSNVSAMFLKTSDLCIVKGNLKLMNDGVIQITDIPRNAKIKEGDEVITSNVSANYLPGIPIGYLKDLQIDATNLTKSGHLVPCVHFDKLDIVLVITKIKQKLY